MSLMDRRPKFAFYERVIVRSAEGRNRDIEGELGAVLGRGQDDGGRWFYAVHVYSKSVCYSVKEADLEPTGQFDRRSSFNDGTTARVDIHGEPILPSTDLDQRNERPE